MYHVPHHSPSLFLFLRKIITVIFNVEHKATWHPAATTVASYSNITKCTNKFKYILYADDSTLSTCIAGDNVTCMDSTELINNELKCLNRIMYGAGRPEG